MVEVAVEEALVWVAVRGLAGLPSSRLVVRFYRDWSFQFARLPSSSLLVLGLWSKQEAAAEEAEARMGAWEYRVQLLPGLQVYATESAIYLSGALGEPFRQQAVQPQSSNSNHLWQSHQPLVEGAVVDCCWISQVLPQLCRPDFVTNFAKYC